MSALKYWVWLTTLSGLSEDAKLLLLHHLGSPESVYYAESEELADIEPLAALDLAPLQDKSLRGAEAILHQCARENIFLVSIQDALYPQRLKNIYHPPLLLYGKGAMPLFDEEPTVAVVGTRTCSAYGRMWGEKIGWELARHGAVVVSGMAKGIDGAAHSGAMRAGGFTCAVLGGGVDVVYPEAHRRLYDDIVKSGVVLSEYPPGTPPRSANFPQRNRIISGLSLGCVVVEADSRSGALLTAQHAMEQGRDVFAVPGMLGSRESEGCHQLLRDGAILIRGGEDVLSEYLGRFPHKLHSADPAPPLPPMGDLPGAVEQPTPEETPEEKKPRRKINPKPPQDDEDEEDGFLPYSAIVQTDDLPPDAVRVLRALHREESLLSDELAEKTGMPVQQVLSALTVLEIYGCAVRTGTRTFLRTLTDEQMKNIPQEREEQEEQL